MLTSADKQWIMKYFRIEFHAQFKQEFNEALNNAFDEKFEEFRQFNWNMIATFKDEILSVLHPLQEDHTVVSQHVREHNDTLENHGIRLTLLETSKKSHQAN